MLRLLSILSVAGVMFAQTTTRTAATATSSSAFKLGGAEVQVAGIPNWPVAAGDEVQAGAAPVLISFRDGNRVTLARGSKAKIEKNGDKTLLRLLDGSCSYILKSRLSFGLMAGDKPAEVSGLRGSLSTASAAKAAGNLPVSAEVLLPPPPPTPISR